MSILSEAIYLDDIDRSLWRSNYIGPGYRSVCYNVDFSTKNGQIILFGYDLNDNPKVFVMPWKSYVKYVVKYETNELDIYDRYIATKEFKNVWERKKWVENATGITIVECLRPEQEILHFLFDNDVLNSNFNKQPLKIHYFDIETEISDQFEKPIDARNRINMMTIYDSTTEKFYTWSLEHAEIDFKEDPLCNYPKDKFIFFEFHNDEAALLEHFLDWYENNYPDLNFGWNSRQYDWPYLTRRIENVLGKGAAQRLSPIGKYYIKTVNHDNVRADVAAEIEVNIDGLFIVDGLVLYRDKFQISKPDGGFSLDNIGEVEGCGHKIHYEGTLKDLYLKDFQKFYEYNLRDVDLVKRIEDKCKMVQLARTITSFGLSQYSTIYSSISYLIGSVIQFARIKMNRVMVSYVGEKKRFDGFEGAFVFPTQAGIQKKGIGAIDFASLYPSLIRALNASPETFVGKLLIQYKDATGTLLPINEKNELYFDVFDDELVKSENIAGFYLKYPNGKRKSIEIDKLRMWIKLHGIYTANNTLFRKHEEKTGIIPKWCEYFYNQRKATKKKMLGIFHELNDPNIHFTDDVIAVKKTEMANFDSRQIAIKNMINSIYGMMGTSHSPIANLDMAQSITRSGRFCNTNASMYILKYFQKNYDPNFKGYRIKVYNKDKDPELWDKSKWIDVAAVGGDTDSCVASTKIRIKYCG